ncbi:MAG: hypothetical protein HKO09_08410 [Croceitalea sp.]|nr:hypothetical protein [Croceitalea sp.]
MMKKYLLTFTFCSLLALSCSTDANTEVNAVASFSLNGTWALTDIRYENNTDNTDLIFAQQILEVLVDQSCDLTTFTFNADGTVVAESKLEYLEFNAGANGLEVPCPEQSIIENSLWSLDGDQLTVINDQQEEETITITFEGNNTFIISGEEVDASNYVGADAVFNRQ